MKRIISVVLILLIACAALCGCVPAENNVNNENNENNTNVDYSDKLTKASNPVATIEMNDGGIMRVELFYDKAPNTVKNFISLANSGFYDGLTFHRVIENFMIQGGDPNGNGTGGPGYNIFGEFPNNGFDNDIKHVRGVISMARKGNPYDPEPYYNTAGSQFFIMVDDVASLDGDYAAFGFCFEGMDVADAIVSVDTDSNDKPIKDVVIKSIRVNTGDVKYDEPETIM